MNAEAATSASARVRRRGTWWVRVHLGILSAVLLYILLVQVALALFGYQTLHDVLGERFYNSCIAGGGFSALLILMALLPIDALLAVILVLRRISRSRPGAIVAGLIVLGSAAGLASVGLRWSAEPDPIKDRLFSLITPMDTQFAAGYSSEAFRAVHLGMRYDEVEALLGQPIRKDPWRDTWYSFYSVSPSGGSYWMRIICYDVNDRVVGITAGLWID